MTWTLALGFLKSHWPKVAVGASVLLLGLTVHQCGQLSACKAASGTVASASGTQAQVGSLSATAKVRIIYRDVPGKCPEIAVDLDAGSSASGSQAQALSATASQGPSLSSGAPLAALWLGGGWDSRDFVYGEASFQYHKVLIQGAINPKLDYRIGASVNVFEFH